MAEDIPQDRQILKFLENNFRRDSTYLYAWANFILGDPETKSALHRAISEWKKRKARHENPIPEEEYILKALTYKPPQDIKAVIVGNDPIPKRDLATGLAFSLPEGGTCNTMDEWKKALCAARLECQSDNSYNYEHWARNGVLLWNAALTVEEGDGSWIFKHTEWLNFSARLIYRILKTSNHRPVVGMFLGMEDNLGSKHEGFARIVLRIVETMAGFDPEVIGKCKGFHHPVFPREDNNFIEEATQQLSSLGPERRWMFMRNCCENRCVRIEVD